MSTGDDTMNIADEINLTERELLIAQKAANMAVKQMMSTFYKEVGKSFINRWLIVIGALVVGFGTGKGWIAAPFK